MMIGARHLFYKFSRLGEADDVLYWSMKAEEIYIPFEKFLNEMKIREAIFKWLPKYSVIRDIDHSKSWLEWYTNLQIRLFDRDLSDQGKGISILVVKSTSNDEINVIFRLSTAGLGGYTQYRISIIRISDEYFICQE